VNFTISWIDVTRHVGSGVSPSVMMERPRGQGGSGRSAALGEFWVPAVAEDGAVSWAVTRTGDNVLVPIVAYRTAHRAGASLLATGMEVGMRMLDSLRGSTQDSPLDVSLFLGSECTDLGESYRVFVGMAIRTR
jgi:hypothetical protein